MYDDLFELLLRRMQPLAHVRQNPRFHPEGDALFHSLQTFDLALEADDAPHVIAASLFHDLGKAIPDSRHEVSGAAWLSGIAGARTCTLVAHHMDLLREPAVTRRALRGDGLLDELERLRDYDDRGRRPLACVTSIERALGILLEPGVAERWLDPTHTDPWHTVEA